jgi:hypothetical protein
MMVLKGRKCETDDGQPWRMRVISDNLVKGLSNVMVLPIESFAE